MRARVIYDFSAQGKGELSVARGEEITVIDQSVGDGWWRATNEFGRDGLVPSSYVEPFDLPEPTAPPPPPPKSYPEVDAQPQLDWDDDWDSDDSSSQVACPRWRSSQGESNDVGSQRAMDPSFLSSSTSKISIPHGSASAQSDSMRFAPIRKAFSRTHIKCGAEDFLLQLEPPSAPHTEAIIEHSNGVFTWKPAPKPFQCTITSFRKDTKMKGMKSFIAYQLTSPLASSHVNRRYKHFDWLHARLTSKFPCICIPPLPEKVITGRYEDEFVDDRRKWLQQWLDRMCRHPVVSQSSVFQHFLSCADDKRWKQGKREAETDRIQGFRFYYAVDSKDPASPSDYNAELVEKVEKFTNDLDRSIKGLYDTLTDFHRKHSSNTRKDFLSLSSACVGVCRAIDGDLHTASLNSNISAAFLGAAEAFKSVSVYHAVESESVTQLISCVRDYSRLFSTLPNVALLAKSANIATEEVRRLSSEDRLTKVDAVNIQTGSMIIGRSVQAECNLLMSQLRSDLMARMRDYLRDRANFYRHMADQLDSSAALF